ncbi:MAG TPA: biopolymer transporter ExbD [bacterium]|jgi:biopolymer transport protein ExbD|nr:biopolymer transporter ExbD [bacterium]
MSANYIDDDGTVTGINITPMVDIMMVLLIVFMVTANFVSEQGLKISVPKTQDTETSTTVSLSVAVNEKGELLFKSARTTVENLKAALVREVVVNPNVRVTLAADNKLSYQQVVNILDVIKQAGVTKVALTTEK